MVVLPVCLWGCDTRDKAWRLKSKVVARIGRQKRRFARMTEIFFDDDNDGCNDNYDDNFGNFDDDYDKND